MQTKNYIQLLGNENKKYVLPLAIFTCVFLFFFSKLSPFYPTNDWADVSVYLAIGRAVFQGKMLYSEVFDPKGPLIFFLYGFSSLINSSPFLLLFIFQCVFWYVALLSVFRLGEQLGLRKINSFIVTILFLPFAINFMYTGGSPEEFILLANTISMTLSVSYFKDKKKKHNPKYMLIHGINSSIIFFLKLNLTIFLLIMLIFVTISIIKNEGVKSLIKNVLYYICGLLIVALPILLYFIVNGNVLDAFNTYIILNKKLAIRIPIKEVLLNGVIRLYIFFKSTPFTFVVLFLGLILFPVIYIKNILGRVAFYIAMFALLGMIFFAGVFHFYYPLPLIMLVVLGLYSLMYLLRSSLNLFYSRKLVVLVMFACFISSYYTTHLFDIGFRSIVQRLEMPGVSSHFASIIEQEENPTLLNLSYGAPSAVFTICDIVPNVRYFTALNIGYDVYPDLINEQIQYIKNKECQFIILSEQDSFFLNNSSLEQNYDQVASYLYDDIENKELFMRSYRLYKAKP